MRRTTLVLALVLGAARPAAALDLMTGDGLLLELSEGPARREAALAYLAGTLDSLILVNAVATAEEGRLFCLSEERERLLEPGLLRQEFVAWLRAPTAGRTPDLNQGRLPLPMLAWSFLAAKFPCAPAAAEPLEPGVRSRLLQSAPTAAQP